MLNLATIRRFAACCLIAAPLTLQAQSGAIDARTFDQLSKAQNLAAEGNHDDALHILDRLKERGKLNGYARAQLWNFYAFIYASQDQYQPAIDAYAKVLAEPEAPEGLILTAKYTTAQLYFQQEKYDQCIAYMEEWLESAEKPTPTAHIMLAQAYYQKNAFDQALRNVDAAIALERKAGKTIQESWLRLKAVLYYQQNDYARTAEVYEELIAHYPKLDYLKQLAGMYSELGEDARRLSVFDAIYEYGGLDKDSELLNLAYMWLGENVPFKAGRVIESEMEKGRIPETQKTIETLANAWAQANEIDKAIPTLRKAAELSGDGIFHARLAGVHFNAGDYASAVDAAIKADELGGLKNPAGNLMLLGMAYFNQREYEPALQAFRRAKQDRDIFAAANKWEKYTLSEIKQIRAIAKAREELKERTRDALEAQENNVDAIGVGS